MTRYNVKVFIYGFGLEVRVSLKKINKTHSLILA